MVTVVVVSLVGSAVNVKQHMVTFGVVSLVGPAVNVGVLETLAGHNEISCIHTNKK